MEYTVVYANKIIELIEKVNSLINKGWLPQGGFCFCDCFPWNSQAMVKNKV